jgi:tetratricopeptide (TPR) repeat protein
VRLITQYVRLFLSDDHDSALNYLYLITLYPTEDMVELCREQICNYIIRHNNYTYILGSPESRRGYLDKFKPLLGIELYDVDNYRRYILAPIAQKLEAQGKYEDAVKIYELGEQYTEALKVLNRQLDYALNREGRDVLEQKKFDSHLIEVSMSILKNYKNSFIQCDDTVLFNHNVLLKFLQATNFYESGNADETIKVSSMKR